MRRPKLSVPVTLSGLHYNASSRQYEITEGGITYGMQLELTWELKFYFRNNSRLSVQPSVAAWYRGLDKEEKKQVVRTGKLPKEISDFYADPFLTEGDL